MIQVSNIYRIVYYNQLLNVTYSEPRREPRRRTDVTASADGGIRKKEGEEIKTSTLPRNAAEYQNWFDSTTDAVTACARDAQLWFELMLRIEADDCTFEELSLEDPALASIEANLRSSITKHTVGTEAAKNPDLVSRMTAKREELKRGSPPRQITGRQLTWVVRRFFNVTDGNRKASFELSTLLAIVWPGDAKMAAS